MTDKGGQVIRRKIKAADGRKPDESVFEFAEELNARLIDGLLLEPKFTLTPQFEDAEITSVKSFLAGCPPKSLFATTPEILVHLDNSLTYYWVELGLSGELSESDDLEAFAPSAVDAALARTLVECIIISIQNDLPHKIRISESKLERILDVERLVDNVKYLDESAKVVSFTFKFTDQERERKTTARLVLPVSIIEEITVRSNPNAIEDAPTSGLWSSHMKEETMTLPVEVSAVVERMRLPINDISRFEEGQVFTFPRENLTELTLLVKDGQNLHEVARGRLGLHQQMKAVKLNDAPASKLKSILNIE